MRSAVFVAILVASAALLAGCSSKKDTELLYTCPTASASGSASAHPAVTISGSAHPSVNTTAGLAKFCPGASSGSRTNTTSLAPNILPILKLSIKDTGGNKTNVTQLLGNLTFDATGSYDPDGFVTGIAVTVQDSNTTRTASLFDPVKKTFKPATFRFDRPGVVNVTVAMVDDRAGFTVNQTHVYVDQTQVIAATTINSVSGGQVDICAGSGNALADAEFQKSYDFNLVAGAKFVVATEKTSSTLPAGGSDATIAICAPDKTALSDSGHPTVTTKPDAKLPPPKGIQSYFVGALANSPSSMVGVTVVVHYEPMAKTK